MLIQVTSLKELQSHKNKGKVVVAYLKSTCPPCQAAHPLIKNLSDSNPNVKTILVIDDFLGQPIIGTPTLELYQDGSLVEEVVGFDRNKIAGWYRDRRSGGYNPDIKYPILEEPIPRLDLEVLQEEIQSGTIFNIGRDTIPLSVKHFHDHQSLLLAAAITANPLIEEAASLIREYYQRLPKAWKEQFVTKMKEVINCWQIINLTDCCYSSHDKIYYKLRSIKGYGRINCINIMADILLARVLNLYDEETLIYLANYFRSFITAEYRHSRKQEDKEEMISFYKILSEEIHSSELLNSPTSKGYKLAKRLQENLETVIKNAVQI